MIILALKRIREVGLFNLIKIHLKMITGIAKLEDENNTLFFLLNNYVDIKNLPPLKDESMLNFQRCLTALLLIFHRMCHKHGLNYWIEYGTLLGAVRHGSFIPWDDDIDVTMMRDEYDQILPKMQNELKSYGIDLNMSHYLTNLMLSYKREETGLFMDIFPVYEYHTSNDFITAREELIKAGKKCRKYYRNKLNSNDIESIDDYREKVFRKIKKGKNDLILHSPEFNCRFFVHKKEEIFPLQEISFGDIKVLSPHNADIYLKRIYGDNYMGFPRTGVAHHPDKNGIMAKDIAERHGLNHDDIYKELMAIADKIGG